MLRELEGQYFGTAPQTLIHAHMLPDVSFQVINWIATCLHPVGMLSRETSLDLPDA